MQEDGLVSYFPDREDCQFWKEPDNVHALQNSTRQELRANMWHTWFLLSKTWHFSRAGRLSPHGDREGIYELFPSVSCCSRSGQCLRPDRWSISANLISWGVTPWAQPQLPGWILESDLGSNLLWKYFFWLQIRKVCSPVISSSEVSLWDTQRAALQRMQCTEVCEVNVRRCKRGERSKSRRTKRKKERKSSEISRIKSSYYEIKVVSFKGKIQRLVCCLR